MCEWHKAKWQLVIWWKVHVRRSRRSSLFHFIFWCTIICSTTLTNTAIRASYYELKNPLAMNAMRYLAKLECEKKRLHKIYDLIKFHVRNTNIHASDPLLIIFDGSITVLLLWKGAHLVLAHSCDSPAAFHSTATTQKCKYENICKKT